MFISLIFVDDGTGSFVNIRFGKASEEIEIIELILEIMHTSQPVLAWQEVIYSPNNQTLPLKRWGHRIVRISNSQLLLFGGFGGENSQDMYLDDLCIFDLATYQWKNITATGDLPQKRSNYSIHYNAHDDTVILFGGGASNKIRFNTVCVLDIKTMTWRKIDPNPAEDAPWERTYHSGEFCYPYMVIYGGEGVSSLDLDDCWSFNVITNAWKRLQFAQNNQGPKQRRFHSTALISSYFYVVGGCRDNYELIGDIHRVDLKSLFELDQTDGFVWEKMIENDKSLQRWGHSCDTYDDRIYIFAGRISSTTDTNDIILYDPAVNNLKPVKIKQKNSPKPRRRHASLMVGNSLLCFGGYNGKYLNDFSYLTLPHEAITYKTNVIITKTVEEFSKKMKSYEKKIYANWSMQIRHQQQTTKIATDKQILLKNELFDLLHRYSANNALSIQLPQFCSIDMFRIIHLFMMQNDAILCNELPLTFYFNLIASIQYFNCPLLLLPVEDYLLSLLDSQNCSEMLNFSIKMNLKALKLKAAQMYLKENSTKQSQRTSEDDNGTNHHFATKIETSLEQPNQGQELIKQTLNEVHGLIKFQLEQTQLRHKSPNFFTRTAQQIKRMFSQSQSHKEQRQSSEKPPDSKVKRGCLSRVINFFQRLSEGWQD